MHLVLAASLRIDWPATAPRKTELEQPLKSKPTVLTNKNSEPLHPFWLHSELLK